MWNRKLLLPVALAAAFGVPYMLYEKDWAHAAKDKFLGMVSYVVTDEPVVPQYKSEFTFGPQAENPRPQSDGGFLGPTIGDFGDIIRFDVPPQWVSQRWPRVTTVLAESGLEGLRVPVMSGTRVDDLAGTLTYYFDREHRVQRLAFDGFTGDERRLLTLITQHYGLQTEPSLDAGMYVSRWNGRPTSVLRVSRAPVMTADSPHSQLHLQLELNRPSAYYGLSPEFQLLLHVDHTTRRW